MKHLNSNLLCAVAIMNTEYEILEIAVIPLAPDLKVSREYNLFNILIKPEKIERTQLNFDNTFILKCMEKGFDKNEAAELFEIWFEKLNLPYGKKVMVLSHNWVSKIEHIKNWLQPTGFNNIFHHEYRDPQVIGLYYNDVFDIKNELCPFPKVKLSYMAATRRIEYAERLPTVIDEAQATIDLYRNLLTKRIL